mmetsp:Transcript_39833/g.103100  ORF Transcript_39833/g.103100 Transcript_39833/m.103100 type:complete len:241 (-) Transcript_39833:202-924(-)
MALAFLSAVPQGQPLPHAELSASTFDVPAPAVYAPAGPSGGMGLLCVGAVASAGAMARRAAAGSRKKAGASKHQLRAEPVTAPPPFDPAAQVGAMPPLGFFDPAGFCKKGDEKGFRNFRTAEIKHGRVAMMAALGAVVQHFVKFPGFQDVPSGLGAVSAPPGSYGFIALFAITGALELGVWTESDDKAPGDFGDPLGLNQYNEDTRNRELNNGRFAMFSALGVIAAELFTGKDAVEQLGF